MTPPQTVPALPEPLTVPCQGRQVDALLDLEWLLTNRLGAYASGTVIGCNTRRYHGLLVAASDPPVARVVTLAAVTEQVTVAGQSEELGCHEFLGAMSPRGLSFLVVFRNDTAATFVYRIGGVELTKEILLAETANVVSARYSVAGGDIQLRLRPLVALRDAHDLRRVTPETSVVFETAARGIVVRDNALPAGALHLVSQEAVFRAEPDWWYSFHYRAEAARGQDAGEDLYTPGVFDYDLLDGQSCQFTASYGPEPLPLGFATTLERRRRHQQSLLEHLPRNADESSRRLAIATDAFVAKRTGSDGRASSTILAGFPWFADWGRDAFVALPGVLLATGQFAAARRVFQTFAGAISNGMIPNRFDDRGRTAHYNAIDASLWFIVAAAGYMQATGDRDFWREVLLPTAEAIVSAYQRGTRFDIHADADGLLLGGSLSTQLTWMDAAVGSEVITSRHGKAVEVNALWHCVHRILARYCQDDSPDLAEQYSQQAVMIASAFNRTFWNEAADCCYDVIGRDGPDAAIRPNQIFAVSLPHSPLSRRRQIAVVKCVADTLLTPYGLRSLAPDDPDYCGRYTGGPQQRDRVYHQGTVWSFLIGPFIEAYLKVNDFSSLACAQAKHWLLPLEDHLGEAGIGSVSEIFDGDDPHRPRGCFAQAWSVGELLRAKLLAAHGPDGKGRT